MMAGHGSDGRRRRLWFAVPSRVVATAPAPSRATRIGRWLRGLPATYPVTIALLVAMLLATLWARAALGADASDAEVGRYGYGLPAFEAGRPWTVFTGIPLKFGLGLAPEPITVVALVLCETLAGHLRTLITFLVGHVVAVALVAAFLWLVADSGNTWLAQMATVIDVGSSNGAFACLGAWTAFLRAPTRRRIRLGISCYLPWLLLLSGHIFDLTHPVGWMTGLAIGSWLARRSGRRDATPMSRRELGWLVVVAIAGTAYGIWDGWHGGGPGGPFGWGPD